MQHPYTRKAFISWLQTKPREEKYNFLSFDCAVCQYVIDKGLGTVYEGKVYACEAYVKMSDANPDLTQAAARCDTFGELLDRLTITT